MNKKHSSICTRYAGVQGFLSLIAINVLALSITTGGALAEPAKPEVKPVAAKPEAKTKVKPEAKPTADQPEAKAAPVKAETKPVSVDSAVAKSALPEETKDMITARSAFSRGDYQDAQTHVRKVIEADKNNWEAYYMLSLMQGQEGNFALSIVNAEKCLTLKPDCEPAYSVMGRSLAGLNKLPEAQAALEKACELNLNSAINQANLGTVLGRSKNFKGALERFKKAKDISPHYVNAYLGMASCLGHLGDKKGQIEIVKEACKMEPTSPIAHAKLGMLLSESGDVSGGMTEGYTANVLRLKESWNQFLGTFLTAWASVFLVFAGIFAVIFAGSKFKPQEGETLVRSFFLTFYKDKPGRFVVTDKRLIFVPEAFSSWFGATNVSIQREQIESINYLSTVGGGTVSILTRDGSVHQFRMPLLVLDPLRSLLVGQGIVSKDPEA